MDRIQVIAIAASLLFLAFIARLIVRGRLREEYAIIWIVCSVLLIVFSFWRNGLEVLSGLVGVYAPPNLVFTGAIFAIFIYLLHLSVVVSRLHEQNKTFAQEIALLKEKLRAKE
ncbi:MAG TPA: DUF2304 domain-containing protein [Bacteroidia bacterium]|nr:DUF2304 domain-containing protein [Bacteroidia bacterium]